MPEQPLRNSLFEDDCLLRELGPVAHVPQGPHRTGVLAADPRRAGNLTMAVRSKPSWSDVKASSPSSTAPA